MLEPRTHYSQAERLSGAVVHIAGLVAVVGAVPVLIVLAANLLGDAFRDALDPRLQQ